MQSFAISVLNLFRNLFMSVLNVTPASKSLLCYLRNGRLKIGQEREEQLQHVDKHFRSQLITRFTLCKKWSIEVVREQVHNFHTFPHVSEGQSYCD